MLVLFALISCSYASTEVGEDFDPDAPVLFEPDNDHPCQPVADVDDLCMNGNFGSPSCTCSRPNPLPFRDGVTCQDGVWNVDGDVFCPPDTLIDICDQVVHVDGEISSASACLSLIHI